MTSISNSRSQSTPNCSNGGRYSNVSSSPPDCDLESLAVGCDRAWARFLDSYEDSFLRTAWVKSGDWDAAREAVQDALLIAMKRLASGFFDETGVEHLKNYIYFLLKTRGIVSRGSRRLAGEDEFDFDAISAPDSAMDRLVDADELDLVKRVLPALLTERELVVIEALYLRDAPLSNREISCEFEIPYGTVCSDHARALKKLRERFGRDN